MTTDVQTASPLTRLVYIIEYLHQKGDVVLDTTSATGTVVNGQQRSVPVLGGLFAHLLMMTPDGNQYSPTQMNLAYGKVFNIASEAREFVDINSGVRSKEINLRYIDKLGSILGANSTLSPGNVFMSGQHLSRSDMEHIIAIEDNFRGYNKEVVLSQEKIDELVAHIDKLILLVQEIDIDTRLKDRMIQILSVIRIQTLRINIVGANDTVDGLDMYLGQLIKVASSTSSTSEEDKASLMKFIQQSLETVKLVTNVLDAGQKFYPVLQAGAKALGWM